MENLYTPNCIRTFTGKYLNILEPTHEMFCIEDIAHSLSMQPRFGGHLPRFYSVAQHCVSVANLCPKNKLQALMHDASEAYLMDIPSPIKNHLCNYKDIENRLMNMIADKFMFEWPLTDDVKEADKEMLEYEWDLLMIQDNANVVCWSQKESEYQFLECFKKITNGN